MSSQDPRPLLTLLSLATNRERARLIATLESHGFRDIALPGARILSVLTERALSIQAIAEATETTKQFAAREVRKLLEANYVQTEPSAEDKRAILVELTERGRALLTLSRATKHARDTIISEHLGERDMATLRRLLRRLADE